MDSEAPSAPARPRGQLDRLLLVAGLVLLLGASVVVTRHISELAPPREIALDMSAARHDSGACWILSHDLGVESDQDGGTSRIELRENGEPLAAHAMHQAMRDGEAGRFSHWGASIYFSTADGSDPRSNGRVYTAVVPSAPPAWLGRAAWLTALGGAVFAVLGLALAWLRRQRRVESLVWLAAGAALLAYVLPIGTWHGRLDLLRAARAHLDAAPAERVAHASSKPGNVTRLLPGAAAPNFEALEQLGDFDGQRRLTVVAEPGVELRDGFARLTPGGPGLFAELDPMVALSDVAELFLPIRVSTTGALELALRNGADDGSRSIEIAVPLRASDSIAAVRVQTPLSLFVHDPATRVDRVLLSTPKHAPGDMVVALDELVLSSPEAIFLQSDHGLRDLARDRDLRPAAWQSVAGRFREPLAGAAGNLVKGSVGLFGRAGTEPVSWRVVWESGAGERHLVASGSTEHGAAWRDVEGALPPSSGAARDGALLFEADALPPGTALGWSGWRLVDTSRPARRAVFLVLDTLRRDALSSFGGTSAQTPFLDSLAESGVRFTRAYSQAYWTRPSMPSLMTGRYVAATGVERLTHQLPESYTTLAEAFAESGFLTLADVSNTNAGPAAGLDQGWDQMHHFAAPSRASTAVQLGDELFARLAAAQEEDLLLYIHLMDAHGPYGPAEPPEHDPTATLEGTELPFDPALDRPWAARVTDAGRKYWYHRDVESMDADLAAFFARLGELWGPGSLDATALALTADHGEYLGEHGEWGHGWHDMMPEVTNVPMFVRAPGLPAGVTIPEPVENIDVAPTLLALLDLPSRSLPDIDGASLLPVIRGESGEREAVAVSEVGLGGSRMLSIYGPRVAAFGVQGTLTAWARLDEHGEAHPRARPSSQRQSLLTEALDSRVSSGFEELWERHVATGLGSREDLWADVDTSSTTIDPLALQQLEALGYLGDD